MAKRRTQAGVGGLGFQSKEPIRVESFSSWDSFKSEYVERLWGGDSFVRGRFLFRGQSDPTWTCLLYTSPSPRDS